MVRHDSAPGNTPGGPAPSRPAPASRIANNCNTGTAPNPVSHGRASTGARFGNRAQTGDRIDLALFVAAFIDAEARIRDAEEATLAPSAVEVGHTVVALALRVACRLAAGLPGWKRFDAPASFRVGIWLVALAPSAEAFAEVETLTVRPFDAEGRDDA